MNEIWVLDDDQAIRWVLNKALEKQGYGVRVFERPSELFDALGVACPTVIVSDIRMGEMSGIEVLKRVKQLYPSLPVIMMTARTDLDSTVSAFNEGAFDYLPKPFDISHALSLIERACQQQVGVPDSPKGGQVVNVVKTADPSFQKMMTQSASPAMQEVYRTLGRLASTEVTVLITGESGTGKELIARAVHNHSQRRHKPFIALNMAAIPKDLLEAELFGHERGSFTGATHLRRGRFEEAHGGTLFLDEIGDMPLDLQTRLLRVLSEGNFYRIGGSEPVQSDVRIIAATHQPLEERVKNGLFREDLFHRLNVIRLRIPPLRERREDIPPLCLHFLKQAALKQQVEPKVISPELMRIFQTYDYPGNVRQLENFCQWITVMAPSTQVQYADLPYELTAKTEVPKTEPAQMTSVYSSSGGTVAWQQQLAETVQQLLLQGQQDIGTELLTDFERVLITTTLAYCKGRKIETAQRLGMGRNTLTRKLKELDL